jgi:hypothetical protein
MMYLTLDPASGEGADARSATNSLALKRLSRWRFKGAPAAATAGPGARTTRTVTRLPHRALTREARENTGEELGMARAARQRRLLWTPTGAQAAAKSHAAV